MQEGNEHAVDRGYSNFILSHTPISKLTVLGGEGWPKRGCSCNPLVHVVTYVCGQVFKAILPLTAKVENGTHHLKGGGQQGTIVAVPFVLDNPLVPAKCTEEHSNNPFPARRTGT